jgi:predicted ABC-type ATPase
MAKVRKSKKLIIIIAGPNGAGKTTFANGFLEMKGKIRFLNADQFARNRSPEFPEGAAIQAGKDLLHEMELLVDRGENFAFEITLSGRTYARRIREWRTKGFRVELVFLVLQSAEIAVNRVKTRVEQRGHNVPEDVVRRRYKLGLENFDRIYQQIVNSWAIYDNSGSSPMLIRTSYGI